MLKVVNLINIYNWLKVVKIMKFFRYMKSLIETDTGNSSKSFTLVLSAIISFIAGLTMCSVICYDGFKDGIIDTDLEKAGIFMLCMGGFMTASGVPKIFGDRFIRRSESFEETSYYSEQRKRHNETEKECGD